jgi:hypothetical protein
MSASAQYLVKNLFAAFGLEIRKEHSETFPRPNMKGAQHQLSSLGFKPRTVIDFEPFLRKVHFAEQAKELS